VKNTTLAAFALTLAAALTVGASPAFADETPKPPAAKTKAKGAAHDYEYKFDDDPMQAGGNGAYTAQIKVVKMGAKNRLIRPRTQFVTELLRSVEQL